MCKKTILSLFTALFFSIFAVFSQSAKNEVNAFIGILDNSKIPDNLLTKGVNYDRWIHPNFSVGGGIVSYGGVSIYKSWKYGTEHLFLEGDINRVTLDLHAQFEPVRISFKGQSIGLRIKPTMLIDIVPMDVLAKEQYTAEGYFIARENKTYHSGTHLYWDGMVGLSYKYQSLIGINLNYRISNIDVYQHLRNRKLDSLVFNDFLSDKQNLQGFEIGLSFYF